MPRQINFDKPAKTYATEQNAVAAIEKTYGSHPDARMLGYIVKQTETGRFFPVLIGADWMRLGAHFNGFCIAA